MIGYPYDWWLPVDVPEYPPKIKETFRILDVTLPRPEPQRPATVKPYLQTRHYMRNGGLVGAYQDRKRKYRTRNISKWRKPSRKDTTNA